MTLKKPLVGICLLACTLLIFGPLGIGLIGHHLYQELPISIEAAGGRVRNIDYSRTWFYSGESLTMDWGDPNEFLSPFKLKPQLIVKETMSHGPLLFSSQGNGFSIGLWLSELELTVLGAEDLVIEITHSLALSGVLSGKLRLKSSLDTLNGLSANYTLNRHFELQRLHLSIDQFDASPLLSLHNTELELELNRIDEHWTGFVQTKADQITLANTQLNQSMMSFTLENKNNVSNASLNASINSGKFAHILLHKGTLDGQLEGINSQELTHLISLLFDTLTSKEPERFVLLGSIAVKLGQLIQNKGPLAHVEFTQDSSLGRATTQIDIETLDLSALSNPLTYSAAVGIKVHTRVADPLAMQIALVHVKSQLAQFTNLRTKPETLAAQLLYSLQDDGIIRHRDSLYESRLEYRNGKLMW